MCGIFGLVQTSHIPVSALAKMSELLRHRGPDDEGFAHFERPSAAGQGQPALYGGADTPIVSFDERIRYCPSQKLADVSETLAPGLLLAHRRLSIIDLTASGHQPMTRHGRYWITYNGEVYNYIELRSMLRDEGYSFQTESDTEVILAAFEAWGPQCLNRFNGMWSIAIYDSEARRLFLARDNYGIKPLYLYKTPGCFAFSSEIKAFSALDSWNPSVNRERMLDLLIWNLVDHTDETLFEGVTQLPAGHYLDIDIQQLESSAEDGLMQIEPVRWYHLGTPATPRGADAARAFADLLNDSIKLRMRSDVPVGSCLSGGLDSSAIVCLATELLRETNPDARLEAVTATSADKAYDESNFARMVAERSGCVLNTCEIGATDAFDTLNRIIWHQDEPVLSSSSFAQWRVFEAAREHDVTVMLDGQGADEILCGYRGYWGAHLADLLRRFRWRRWLSEARALRAELGMSYARSVGYTLAYLFPGMKPLLGRFDGRAYSESEWISSAYRDHIKTDPYRLATGPIRTARDMSEAQLFHTHLPMLLHWEDRNSMASSIEARVPFLDPRLVEFCLALDPEEKLKDGLVKSVLRRGMRGTVPDKVLDRRDKMGFLTAEPAWATGEHAGRFRSELEQAIKDLGGIVTTALLDQFDEVVAGRRSFDFRYWRVISAARWVNVFSVTV